MLYENAAYRGQKPCEVCPSLVGRMLEPGSERVILSKRCERCVDRLRAMGCDIRHEFPFLDAVTIEIPRILLPLLARGNCAASVEPDVRIQVAMDKACSTIGARISNRSRFTGRGVTIAIADTGIYPHPDFIARKNRIKHFVDLVGSGTKPYDDNGHGTFCAGCAAGDGSASGGLYAGVAPEAELAIIKAMDATGGGTASDVLGAMQWVIDHHREYNIKVFSLSLGAIVSGFMVDAMARGAQILWDQGVIVVAAAGNNGPRPGSITSPGTARCVLTVGAVDDRREGALSIPPFSSRGPVAGESKPDLVAPGVELRSVKSDVAYLSGVPKEAEYTTLSGTSVACPIVAGCCALLIQAHPTWTPEQIKQAMLRTAHRIDDDQDASGRGIIDIAAALGLNRAIA